MAVDKASTSRSLTIEPTNLESGKIEREEHRDSILMPFVAAATQFRI
jgi:hypothetical protein